MLASPRCHPLQLLDDEEIRCASSIIIRHIQEEDQRINLHFKNVSLHDPPKALLLPHLDAEAGGVSLERRPYVPRCVDIIWSTDNERKVTESTVSLDSQTVVGQIHTRKGQYGPNDRYEVKPNAGRKVTYT